MDKEIINLEINSQKRIDWPDIIFVFFLGCIFAPMKYAEIFLNDPGGIGNYLGEITSLACIVYILWRADREPAKLREWGLTTPISMGALIFFIFLLSIAIVWEIIANISLGGTLYFDSVWILHTIDYLYGAFPQQFALCSVAVVQMERLPKLRGNWRIPLLAGCIFLLAHIYTIIRDPTSFNLQFMGLMVLGTAVVYYFLRYRTIVPIVVLHAIIFIMNVNLVDPYL